MQLIIDGNGSIQATESLNLSSPDTLIGNDDGGLRVVWGERVEITNGLPLKPSGPIQFTPILVEHLPPTPEFGMIMAVSDSDTNVWGEIIGGEGTNKVLVFFNGTNWTVLAK